MNRRKLRTFLLAPFFLMLAASTVFSYPPNGIYDFSATPPRARVGETVTIQGRAGGYYDLEAKAVAINLLQEGSRTGEMIGLVKLVVDPESVTDHPPDTWYHFVLEWTPQKPGRYLLEAILFSRGAPNPARTKAQTPLTVLPPPEKKKGAPDSNH